MLTCLVPVLFTFYIGVLKLKKKKIPAPKGLIRLKILGKYSKFPVDASFLRNKAAVLGDTIKWTFCIR